MTAVPWLLVMVALPAVASLFALAVPGRDRLTLRGVGVFGALAAFGAGVAALVSGDVDVDAFGWRLRGVAVPAAFAILGVTPMALRAGAPRVQTGLQAYVAAVLSAESLALAAVVVDDLAVAVAVAVVGAVPVFALVALFGGPERGSVTWRAASLWLLVDSVALGAVVVGGSGGGDVDVVVVVALLGPGLVRLAAGPHGLWALPVFEQAPVAAACLLGGLTAPVGVVLLARAVDVADGPGLAAALAAVVPWLASVLAVACAVGAALVTAERDLRRIVAHLIGVLGATAALVVVAGAALDAAALVALMGFSSAACVMLVEAVERRLETRKTPELRGLMAMSPLLAVLLPWSFVALCGLPGPGVAAALWPALARVSAAAGTALPLAVCAAALLVAGVGCARLLARVSGEPRQRLTEFVRVSPRQGMRLLVPVLALAVASLLCDAVLRIARGTA